MTLLVDRAEPQAALRLLHVAPTHYATIKRPRHSPKQVKRMLERRYDFYLSPKYTLGNRARECALILRTAAEDGVTLDRSVEVGCRFWVLLDERMR